MSAICKNNFQAAFSPKVDQKPGLQAKCEQFFASPYARIITFFFFALAFMAFSQDVFAWTTPAAGSFGYNVYDIAVNKIAKGPIGFVGGGWLIATGATKMNEGWMRAVPYVLGGSCLIKVDEMTQTLGALIN
ncbi:conjugative transfer protein TraE [Pectobacterium carotovorum subsp. carotovorum]|nr:conjugative transfer protein TraE [Pectobacterium carotovorum]MCL6336318.1 conjugative transfer protein TraE [Pectobacterium carotovorum subsp. carotovorum]